MKRTGNTILITGGASGIGRGLAGAFEQRGNKVIISGRSKSARESVLAANPEMVFVESDVTDPASIMRTARDLIAGYPGLNVLINNAGIQKLEDLSGVVDDADMLLQVNTNLLGPVRMTNALIEHLKSRPAAAVINVSSVLAFVPWAIPSIYSATKAFLHSYTLSLRWKLKGTSVKVFEILPPWVQTELMGDADIPAAMRLEAFIEETMTILGTGADEIAVKRAQKMRNNAGPGERPFFDEWNNLMAKGPGTPRFTEEFNRLVDP